MLEILDQLPDSYLAFAGRLSEITARAMHYGIEAAGRMRYTFFAQGGVLPNIHAILLPKKTKKTAK
jgi:hypothetical protein